MFIKDIKVKKKKYYGIHKLIFYEKSFILCVFFYIISMKDYKLVILAVLALRQLLNVTR